MSKVGRLAALFAVIAWQTGCVAFVRPEGDWVESPDLRLDTEALSGVKLRVDCVLDGGDDELMKDDGPNCGKLRVTLGELGATVLIEDPPEAVPAPGSTGTGSGSAAALGSGSGSAATARVAPSRGKNDEPLPRRYGDLAKETPDFRVLYVSHASDSDYCGITLVTFLFFGMLCLEDIDSSSELRVLDVARGIEVRKEMTVKVRRVLGAAALPVLAMQFLRQTSRQDDRRVQGRLFLRYLQNTVYTFAARERIAALGPGGAPP